MTRPAAPIVLRRHELLWLLEQCGAGDWPYPLAPVAWPADTEDETVLARAGVEDALAGRGLLDPGPAAALLAVGTAVRDRRRQIDLVRRSTTTPLAAVAVGADAGAALLLSADHAGADVHVRPLRPDELVPATLALLPRLPAAPGPPLPVHAGVAEVETRRRERMRLAVDDVLGSATAWTQLGVRTGPDEVTSPARRGDAAVKWLDSPRGRYRLRHDPGQAPGGPVRLVPDDTASPGVRAELEALLGAR